MNTSAPAATPCDVLDFWLGDGLTHGWPTQDLGKRWFGGGAALDEDIKTRFGARVLQAINGDLSDELGGAPGDWSSDPYFRTLDKLTLQLR